MKRLLVTLILVGTVAGCRATPSVDQRLRNHFQITEVKEVTPEAVRQGIVGRGCRLARRSRKSTSFSSKAASDRTSSVRSTRSTTIAESSATSTPIPATYNMFGSKHKGYAIYFVLDYRNQLHDIRGPKLVARRHDESAAGRGDGHPRFEAGRDAGDGTCIGGSGRGRAEMMRRCFGVDIGRLPSMQQTCCQC